MRLFSCNPGWPQTWYAPEDDHEYFFLGVGMLEIELKVLHCHYTPNLTLNFKKKKNQLGMVEHTFDPST